MCEVYTSRVVYRGAGRLDTTVKSGEGLGRLLAPSWELVGGVKRWRGYAALAEAQYTAAYYDLLRMRYKADAAPFLALLEQRQLVLCCYCATGAFCHRHLAVAILDKIASAKGMPFSHCGELRIG